MEASYNNSYNMLGNHYKDPYKLTKALKILNCYSLINSNKFSNINSNNLYRKSWALIVDNQYVL